MKNTERKNKKRTYQYLLLFVILAIFSYRYGISPTISLYNQNNLLKQRIETSSNPNNVNSLKQKIDSLEKSISIIDTSSVEFQHKIMEESTKLCEKNNCRLVKMPKGILSNSNNYLLETYTITLQGSFFKLLLILDEWEKTIGHLISVKFEYVSDKYFQTDKLLLILYIQKINKNE